LLSRLLALAGLLLELPVIRATTGLGGEVAG